MKSNINNNNNKQDKDIIIPINDNQNQHENKQDITYYLQLKSRYIAFTLFVISVLTTCTFYYYSPSKDTDNSNIIQTHQRSLSMDQAQAKRTFQINYQPDQVTLGFFDNNNQPVPDLTKSHTFLQNLMYKVISEPDNFWGGFKSQTVGFFNDDQPVYAHKYIKEYRNDDWREIYKLSEEWIAGKKSDIESPDRYIASNLARTGDASVQSYRGMYMYEAGGDPRQFKRHGYGEWPFMGTFKGLWQHGRKRGYGEWSDDDGAITYKGFWENDRRNGYGEKTDRRHTKYTSDYRGEWKDDKESGLGEQVFWKGGVFKNGDKLQGIFEDDILMDGLFIRATDNGVYNVHMKDGKLVAK